MAAVAEPRGWTLVLGSLSALLLAAATVTVLLSASIAEGLNEGVSYSSESDPAFIAYRQLSVLSQVLNVVGAPLGIAAGLSIVAFLFVLAQRWDARARVYRLVVSE